MLFHYLWKLSIQNGYIFHNWVEYPLVISYARNFIKLRVSNSIRVCILTLFEYTFTYWILKWIHDSAYSTEVKYKEQYWAAFATYK